MSTAGWGVCVLDHSSLQRSEMTGLHTMSGVRSVFLPEGLLAKDLCNLWPGLKDHA